MYNPNFRQQPNNANCDELIQYQYIPTLNDVIKEFHSLTWVVLIFSIIITLTVTLIFIEEIIKLKTKSRLITYLITISVLAVFPVASFCFLLTILIPRTHDVNTTFITLFQPLSLVLFYKLITTYYNGENQLREILIGQRIPLFEHYNFMNKYIPTYFMTNLGFISVCFGLYTMVIFCQMAQNVSNPGLNLNSKYNIIQLFFVCTRCHVLIFDTLGNNDYLPCFLPYISAFTVAIYIRSTLMIIISLILSLIARNLFLKDLPETLLNEQYLTSNESPNRLIKVSNRENGLNSGIT